MYERHTEPLISRRDFAWRMAHHGTLALVLVLLSVILGMVGYRGFAAMSWTDSFLNACMLLGGMGPVGDLPNDGAKIFAGLFALYAGLVFIGVTALLVAPVLHRVLHHFHLERKSRVD